MYRMIAFVLALLVPVLSAAQTLQPSQFATVCTACKAASACNTPRVAGDVGQVLAWLNGAKSPATPAWFTAAPVSAVEEAPTYTTYDSLAAGKRDSWVMFLRNPRDFTKARIRNWVVDVWGTAAVGSNAEAVLLSATYSATNAQAAIGGTSRTTGTVTALNLAYTGLVVGVDAEALINPAACQ